MVDKDSIEKALLIGIIREKNWEKLILNNINKDYFSPANQKIFTYIKEYVDKNTYPELPILCYEFGIDDISMQQYSEVTDLDGLCKILRDSYIQEKLKFELGNLNNHSDELYSDTTKYIQRIGDIYNDMKVLSLKNRTVGLFDNIEEVLKIDPNDVISTGFKELDEKLTGWKRGEELVVFMARTGQGKSWLGLKFALAAAMTGERVGIYSGEMSTQQLQERILCCAKPNYTSTREDSLKIIQDNKLCIRILTQKELRRRATVDDIEEMIIRDKLTMVIVDQLSLMDDVYSKPGTPLRQVYGNISMDLFSLSSKHSLPVILLVQSNREGGQMQNGPALENIAESDAVAQNATRVISMKNENGIMIMNILKNRYGESGLIQKYEVDYGINKYKPIHEFSPESMVKKAKTRQMFGGSKGVF